MNASVELNRFWVASAVVNRRPYTVSIFQRKSALRKCAFQPDDIALTSKLKLLPKVSMKAPRIISDFLH